MSKRPPSIRTRSLGTDPHRGPLASPELRRALAHAIPRERLLNDHFRTDLVRQVHKAINSPYPAGSWPTGCRFAARCEYRFEKCSQPPPLFELGGQSSRCWLCEDGRRPVKVPGAVPA